MKPRLLPLALFGLTTGAVFYYPQSTVNTASPAPLANQQSIASPRVDAVFVLDTTGSMSDLIQTAKEKIWSIATTMASARQGPEVRIGLVAYRDHGDAYVTKIIDLSSDLDSVYASLMDFQADGGGDTPESVNKALYDAVHSVTWSRDEKAYRAIFLVGDAPPHMNYNEMQYPEIVAAAKERGIIINTIQCGDLPMTVAPWTRIAALGRGEFFQVEQAGGAVAFATPYDEQIAELSARLDDTRLYYGSDEQKAKMAGKVAATNKLHEGASLASRARRGVFNASAGGRVNLLGENELVAAVTNGAVALDDLEEDVLPDALKPMSRAEQESFIKEVAEERADLEQRIRQLSQDRDGYLARKVEEAGGLKTSLDQRLYDAVKDQAADAGIEYASGPTY